MNIKTFITGGFQTNTYLVWNEEGTAYIFDCEGERLGNLKKFVEEKDLKVKYIALTHGHSDHICGLNALKNLYPEASVYIGEEDRDCLGDAKLNHSDYIFGINFEYKDKFNEVKDGDFIGEFKVIDTPGHTMGSKSFFCEKERILISGDTMFRRSFGRYDFPGSSGKMLFESLGKLCKLPEDTVVYSGHTESTTIGEERVFLKTMGIIK